MFVVLSNGGKYHGRMDESMMIKFKVSYTSNTNQSTMDCILKKNIKSILEVMAAKRSVIQALELSNTMCSNAQTQLISK